MSRNRTVPGVKTPPEPAVSLELITWLEATYPDRAQSIQVPQREADKYFGHIELIRKLRDMHNRQFPKVIPGQ